MARIVYLDAFPADNALPILAARPEHEVVRIDRLAPLVENFATLATAHVFQCVPARDEVPERLRVDTAFLDQTPELLVISSGGSGVDTFDLDACTQAGVLVVNQAGGNAEAVAEHALGMMLMLMKRVPEADRALRRGWTGARTEFRGADLLGKTVGIIGLGHIGRRLASICRHAFDCQVLAYDPYLDAAEITRRDAEKTDLFDLLNRSDVVSIHCPLSSETRRMFDAETIAAMKPGARLVATARGFIHDEDALYQALVSGHLAGAGLDVWDAEPPTADHPLLSLDNVITSPHTAGVSRDSRERMASYAATQIIEILDGKQPVRPVNTDVLPTWTQRMQVFLNGKT
ncbi:MAG: hydroxyacid dehydrogenase [Minwuia sp.]|nr:hydroxyacid dehydrogenase [Minwuia sp.]